MRKLADFPDEIGVAWFGEPWDDRCSEDIQTVVPDWEDCHGCGLIIGQGVTGASVRDSDDEWLHYHRDCYWEAAEDMEDVDVSAGKDWLAE